MHAFFWKHDLFKEAIYIINIKTKSFFLYVPWRHIGAMEIEFYSFLTLVLDGGEWLFSCPGCCTPGEIAAGDHCVGGWASHTAILDVLKKINVYTLWVWKPEVKRPLGKQRPRWEGNIKMDVKEIGLHGMDWIYLAQDRDRWCALVNTEMCF